MIQLWDVDDNLRHREDGRSQRGSHQGAPGGYQHHQQGDNYYGYSYGSDNRLAGQAMHGAYEMAYQQGYYPKYSTLGMSSPPQENSPYMLLQGGGNQGQFYGSYNPNQRRPGSGQYRGNKHR